MHIYIYIHIYTYTYTYTYTYIYIYHIHMSQSQAKLVHIVHFVRHTTCLEKFANAGHGDHSCRASGWWSGAVLVKALVVGAQNLWSHTGCGMVFGVLAGPWGPGGSGPGFHGVGFFNPNPKPLTLSSSCVRRRRGMAALLPSALQASL